MAIDIHRERTRGEKINWIVYIVKTRDWHVLVGFAESADFDSSPADWQPDKALENNCLFDVTIAWYVKVANIRPQWVNCTVTDCYLCVVLGGYKSLTPSLQSLHGEKISLYILRLRPSARDIICWHCIKDGYWVNLKVWQVGSLGDNLEHSGYKRYL